jgi:hypothetical protein
MWKWTLAAIGVVVLSLAISAAHMRLSNDSAPRPHDPAAYELSRQIAQQYEAVSLVGLLAEPERYDGRKVLVGGFVTLEMEGTSLHLDESAYEGGLRKNALWLDAPDWLAAAEAGRLNRHYGEVAGTFVASQRGHMGAYSGALTQLRRIQPAFTQSDVEQWRLRRRREWLLQQALSGWFLTLVGWTTLVVLWAVHRHRR